MAAWRVELSTEALRDLESLDVPVARRIVKKLEQVAKDPPRFAQRLVGSDLYKVRIGDHCVFLLLSESERTAVVERIGHRSTVYDR